MKIIVIKRWRCFGVGVCLLLALAFSGYTLPAAAQTDSLAVYLEWPNEGETFYAGPTSLLYSIPIKGWVEAGELDPAAIAVRLELVQAGAVTGELSSTLQPDGTFEFLVTVNPAGSDGKFPSEHLTCGDYCHLPGSMDLPAGAVTLRVTAVSSQTNQQAQVERHITVDRSDYTAVPITVYLADTPDQPVAGVKVSASTWLYLWRSRSFSGISNAQGQALVRAEALAEAPTNYVFRVEPTVVDGVLYEGITTAELTLAPGETSVSTPLTLTVQAHAGQVSGTISGLEQSEPLSVWAVRLPTGESYQTTAEQGAFTFAPLPIDRYLLTMDDADLTQNGLTCVGDDVDLLAGYEGTAEISLAATAGLWVNGRILDETGTTLPFAWLTPEQVGAPHSVLPGSNSYLVSELPRKAVSLLINAPGYYSRAKRVDLSSGPVSDADTSLTPQPGTQRVPWGDGVVIVPAESRAEVADGEFVLESGWLWGHTDGSAPIVIHTAVAEISLASGGFALEYLPGKQGWLYVENGRAQVQWRGDETIVDVQAGQMVNLLNDAGLQAVSLDPVVVAALHADRSSPLPLVWEPTLRARIRDQLARVGISTAQLITFITYFLVLTSLFIIPFVTLYLWWKNKKRTVEHPDPRGLT
ncbi:MAG: hypothetical protein CL608_15985 [Anaerolineaceae bacterium]|nr:hypothetical protein [Anaerolineaceae bacterium]